MKKISLLQMKENQKGRVKEICGGAGLRSRMMGMGIYPGREITKLSHLALGGAVTIKAGRSIIALGHGVAMKIVVEAE